MAFKKAVKEQSKLRLALCGLAGSGKTFSALAIASSMSRMMREHGHGEGRIAVIDSERGSASLYADKFEFDVAELESFSPLAYVEKIHEAEREGYDFIIADSISHAWAGKDGALDQKDQAADRKGNSWTAWRDVTPKHNALVDAMLQCRAHFIATMRVKMEYVQEKDDKGRTEIKKIGLASIQREGMDYEFTMVGDVDHSHTLKISKTRVDGIDIGDIFEKPGENFARRVYTWLTSGAAPRARSVPAAKAPTQPATQSSEPSNANAEVASAVDEVFLGYLRGVRDAKSLPELEAAVTGPGRPAKGSREYQHTAEIYLARKAELQAQGAAA